MNEVDKSKSISQLTMPELQALTDRLSAEKYAEELIRSLKSNSGEKSDFYNPISIDTTTPVNQLYHHGILGMKWGIRKTGSGAKTKTPAIKTAVPKKDVTTEPTKTAPVNKPKSIKDLSNDDLKKLNERLNLEKQYKDLTKQEVSKGKSMTNDIMSTALKQTATTVVAAASLYAVKKAIEKKYGADVVSDMFPKKK